MGIGAQLESSTARDGTIVEIGQRMKFWDVGKILGKSPYKSQLQSNLAEIGKRPYYPRRDGRCIGGRRGAK
jgi:hypothetical protein